MHFSQKLQHIGNKYGIFLIGNMKREVAFSVVVYDNYQYLHQAASRFIGECSQI